MPSNDLRYFFHPSSVAVIGASEAPGKIGREILGNIVEAGFAGPIYPINPKSERILGLTCFKDVRDIPGPVDLAVLILPARIVPRAIRECGEKGVKGAVIISGGFAEVGPEGEKLQTELVETAREFGVRVVGPNCQGIASPYGSVCATWPFLNVRGRVGLLSHSGTVGMAMMDWFTHEGLGVSGCVSLGNRSDVDEVDAIEYFESDPDTKVIAAYLEGVKRPERFQEVIRSLSKPLVVLKSGRTPKGRRAAESHTRSLAGADAIYSSLFDRNNVIRAETFEEFYDFAKAFAYLKPPEGNRVFFITSTGGGAVLATDTSEREGLDVSPMPGELAEQLKGIIPAHASWANPLDLTGDATAKMIGEVIQRARPYYDTLAVIYGDPIADASQVVTPGADELVIFFGGAEVEREERLKMHAKGIPVFPSPERGIRALSQLLPAKKKLKLAQHTFPAASGRSQMGLQESFKFLESKGFPVIISRLADSPGKAVHLAHTMGFPVALKIDSPDILHKSDAGGVRLNIQSSPGVRNAFNEMVEQVRSRHPDAAINGVVVSAMASPGLELILGMNRDPQFGPLILFGLGGTAVELFRDVTMRLLPIDAAEAARMIGEIRGAALLKGYRGRQPIDENALVEGLLKLAAIAEEHPDIVEIDLNPAFAYPEGIVVADARILRA